MQALSHYATVTQSALANLPISMRQKIKALSLLAPSPNHPGHWRSRDGFIVLSAHVLRRIADRDCPPLQALVAFQAEDIKDETMQRIAVSFPQYNSVSDKERRSLWPRCLAIGKAVRTEKVAQIVKVLASLGVRLPAHSLRVHRVSYTFYAHLSFAQLYELRKLQDGQRLECLRKITIQDFADS